jgi:mercuric ion transport protein
MTDETRAVLTERETTKETGALLLAIGGLAAAFGAASCCAIPMLLGSLGLGSAWLAGIAIIAAPHRIALITAAIVCLVGAGAVLTWYRRAPACAPDYGLRQSRSTPLIIGFLSVGTMLAVAGYLFV